MNTDTFLQRVFTLRTRFALVATLAVALSGCPGETPPPPPPSPAPRVESFTLSATEIDAGGSVTLSWKVRDAASVELRDAKLGLVSGVEATSFEGSVEVAPSATTLYTLTALNDRGVGDSATVSVRVIGGAQSVTFVASPDRISAGESATLAWSAPGAKTVSLSTTAGEPVDLAGQTAHGTLVVKPPRTTTWQLSVDGKLYDTTVDVAPEISAFVPSPTAATRGGALTLGWKTAGAVRVSVWSAGRGELHATTEASAIADGSFTETVPLSTDPAAALSYILRAESGSGEVVERALTVYIAGHPVVTSFVVPEYAPATKTFTVSWETAEAHTIEVLRGNVVVYQTANPAEVAQGSQQLPTPAVPSGYFLRARHQRGGEALSDEMTVTPVGLPTIGGFESTPVGGIGLGGEPLTLTWTATDAKHAQIAVEDGPVLATFGPEDASGGTLAVYPNLQTTYVLTVDNGIGNTESASLSATVATAAQLTFSAQGVLEGGEIQITGSTANGSGDLLDINAVVFNPPGALFEDISTTGTPLAYTGPDTTHRLITLPETVNVNLFGTAVSSNQVSISPNGWFAFRTAVFTGPDTPPAFPSTALPELAIAPYYADLRDSDGTGAGTASDIYYRFDSVGSERRLIIQWHNFGVDSGNSMIPGSSVTFQAQVYSGGKVIFAYDQLTGFTPVPTTIGLQDHARASAITTTRLPESGDVYQVFGRVTPPATVPAASGTYTALVEVHGAATFAVEGPYASFPLNQFEITELMVNPAVADGQWLELRSLVNDPVDLAGWTLDFGGGTTHTLGAVTLPPMGRVVLGQTGSVASYQYPNGLTLPQAGTATIRYQHFPYTSLQLPLASLPLGRSWQRGTGAFGFTMAAGFTQLECLASTHSTYGANGEYGTPGDPNTPCPNYAPPVAIPGNFEAISTTGAPLTFSNDANGIAIDDGIATLTLPVPFPLDGVMLDTVVVATNGYLTFNPGFICDQYCWSTNKTAPDPTAAPAGVMAPFWDDIDLTHGGGVFWERRVPGVLPNDGYTLISWENAIRFYPSPPAVPTDDLNFQVKLFDTGDIEFHFGLMQSPTLNSATTWFEHPAGTGAFVVNVNNAANVTSNSGYRLAAH